MISSTDPFPAIDQLPVIRLSASGTLPPDVVAATEHGRRAGYEEGLRTGYHDGEAAALEDVRTDVAFALTALHGAIEDLHRRDALGADHLSATTVDLALGIAEAVLGRELSASTTAGRDALARALALAPDRGAAVARLHPDDLHVLHTADVALAEITGGREIELVPDPSLRRGDCILDVGAARVDARIEPALERVRAQLLGDLLHGDLLHGEVDR